MTLLYKPVLISSAEQAEALPIGTLATTGHIPRIARKSRPVQRDSTGGSFGNRHMNGWTALVPIEAEVQAAKADAWDEGYMEATNGNDDPLTDPYRYETGDQA